MRTLYGVLGLPPQVDEGEIKAAFRKLAKQFHPDLRGGDKGAEQRFKEINEAHAILTDPDARARYDASLSQERSLRRLRLRNTATIMASSFVLTVTVILTPIVWGQYRDGVSLLSAYRQWMKPAGNEARRAVAVVEDGTTPVDGKRATGQSTVALPTRKWHAEAAAASPRSSEDTGLMGPPSPSQREEASAHDDSGSDARLQEADRPAQMAMAVEQAARRADGRLSGLGDSKSAEGVSQTKVAAQEKRGGVTDLAMALPSSKDAASWASYRNARFGFTLRYPADIFAFEAAQSDEHVKRFRSRDGRAAVLRIFGTPNLAGRTLAQYRTVLIQERYAKATFDYAPQRDTWFVLSGVAGDDIFYERVTFACDRRSFHGWMLVFPASERGLYERIIEEMHRNYRRSNGPGARCGVGKPQVSAGTKPGGGTIDGSM